MKYILIVDDSDLVIASATKVLQPYYEIVGVNNGKIAIDMITARHPDLILLDIIMPEMDGKEIIRIVKSNPLTQGIPIIFLTSDTNSETERQCFDLGASDFLTKPFNDKVMLKRIERIIELNDLHTSLELRLKEKTTEVSILTIQAITAISSTIDEKDDYTKGHSLRVAGCSVEIARELGWSEDKIRILNHTALLHDIGKIGIPDAILNKPGRLSKEEFNIIKSHTTHGGEILKKIKSIPHLSDGALFHHERYDGFGYPFGLKGDSIPPFAKIIGIADAFDAMSSTRIYRSKLCIERIRDEIVNGRGTQFDPTITDVFLEMIDRGFSIENCDSYENSEEKRTNELIQSFSENSITDPLTGFWTSVNAEVNIDKYMSGTTPGGSFLLINIDGFKSIIEKFGHVTGDKIISELALVIVETSLPKDINCRIGNDEFAVFTPLITERKILSRRAATLLLKLQEKLAQLDISGPLITVSVAICIAPYDGISYKKLYENASKTLYYIKRSKKNSYDFFSDEYIPPVIPSTQSDISVIKDIISNSNDTSKAGALGVDYERFNNICAFILRHAERSANDVQICLFTLADNTVGGTLPIENQLTAMSTLSHAITNSLRRGDVFTRFSSSQFLVVLMDVNRDNSKNIIERIINNFYRINGNNGISLKYDIDVLASSQKN